jgi:hypothetical protein
MAANVKEQVDRETIRVTKCLVVKETAAYSVKKDIITFVVLVFFSL